MKSYATVLVFALCCFLSLNSVSAQTITSNGTGGGDWNTGTTWLGGVVPGVSDNVVVQGSDIVTLSAAGSCANLTLNAGTTLVLNGVVTMPGTSWNFAATSTVDYAGTQTSLPSLIYGNLIWRSVSVALTADITVNGNLSITTATVRGVSGTSGTFTHTVAGDVLLTGASSRITAVNSTAATTASVTWNIGGSIKLTGASSNNRVIMYESGGPHSGSATFNINGNLEIGASSQVQFKSSSSTTADYPAATINLKGNLVQNGTIGINSGTGTSPGLTINFNGTSAQTWSGSGSISVSTFTLTMNVNNTAGVILGTSRTIGTGTTVTLSSGTLTTTPSTLLTIGTGTITGGSSSSYVNGPLALTLASTSSTPLTFPIGKEAVYRPVVLTITQDAVTSTTYQAEVLNSAPSSRTLAATHDKVSSVRQWNIVKGTGAMITAATVQLAYDADDQVSDAANLRVAKDDGPIVWIDLGGTGTAPTTGTITSTNNFTMLGYFVLANAVGGANVLPVELNSFTASAQDRVVVLRWSTSSEVNNYGFEIERRSEQASWVKIGFLEGHGTSTQPHSYSFSVASDAPASYSFRLKQINHDGSFSYSRSVEAAVVSRPIEYRLSQNYPNPFNPSTTVHFAVAAPQYVTVKVYSMLGQEVRTLYAGMANANVVYNLVFDADNLSSGTYFSVLKAGDRTELQKMILMK